MRHAVLGAGGIGGLVGGALARSGQPVTFVVRADQPATLEVRSQVLGDFEVAVASSMRLEEAADVLWVTVKATQLEPAMASVAPELVREGVVIPLLNGIDHVGVLAARYGAERVVAGSIRVESERVAPGQIFQNGPFAVIEVAGPPETRERLERVCAEVGAAGLTCSVEEDPATVLWTKLAMLAPFALASTAAGLDLGGLRGDPEWRRRLIACSQEVLAVAAASGVEVRGGWEGIIDAAPSSMRTSMQKDVAAGRPPELDAIAGPVLRLGRAHGVDVSTTEELAALLRARAGLG